MKVCTQPVQPIPPNSMSERPDWIFGSDAAAVIAATRTRLASHDPLTRILSDLRKELSPDQASHAFEMAHLQIDARQKFSCSEEMLFTRKGMEQATNETVARYKAGLVAEGLPVADACCGIGGDSLELVANHPTVAIELDGTMARIARHNLAARHERVTGRSPGETGGERSLCNFQVVQADFDRFDFSGFGFVHVDPDRRAGKSRTTQPEFMTPSWNSIVDRLGNRFAAVKVAPATELDPFAEKIHRQWIGSGRECREQLVWFHSPDFPVGGKTATVVDRNGNGESIFGTSASQPRTNSPCAAGDRLFEPHSAVFAAGLDGELAVQLGLVRLSADSPYLIGQSSVTSTLMQEFLVLHVDSFDRKRMVAALRRLNVGKIEWKQRGVEPSTFQSVLKIRGPGSEPATVVLFRTDRRINFAICSRI